MAKGYWIARVDISDVEGYQAYVRACLLYTSDAADE